VQIKKQLLANNFLGQASKKKFKVKCDPFESCACMQKEQKTFFYLCVQIPYYRNAYLHKNDLRNVINVLSIVGRH
jgi:hypothetical protein